MWASRTHIETTQPLGDLPVSSAQLLLKRSSAPEEGGPPGGEEVPVPKKLRREHTVKLFDRGSTPQGQWPRPPRGTIGEGLHLWEVPEGDTWEEPAALCIASEAPAEGVRSALLDEAGQLEVIVEAIDALRHDEAGITSVSLVDRRVGLANRGPNSRRRIARWQKRLDVAVRLFSAGPEAVVLATVGNARGSARPAGEALLLLDPGSGNVLLTLALAAPPLAMRLARGGGALLIVDCAGRATVFAVQSPGVLRQAMEARLPATFLHLLREPGGAARLEVGFLPGGGEPYLRQLSGEHCTVAFHSGLRAWLALDLWRHAGSPLQCHAPLACPKEGALAQLLWAWRRPRPPPGWGPGEGDLARLSPYGAHLARLAHLEHSLAVMLTLGTGPERRAAVKEILAYARDVDFAELQSGVEQAGACEWAAA